MYKATPHAADSSLRTHRSAPDAAARARTPPAARGSARIPACARRDCVAQARLDRPAGTPPGLSWRRGITSRPATRRGSHCDLPLARRRCDASCAQRGGCAEGPEGHRFTSRSPDPGRVQVCGQRDVWRARHSCAQLHTGTSPLDSSVGLLLECVACTACAARVSWSPGRHWLPRCDGQHAGR